MYIVANQNFVKCYILQIILVLRNIVNNHDRGFYFFLCVPYMLKIIHKKNKVHKFHPIKLHQNSFYFILNLSVAVTCNYYILGRQFDRSGNLRKWWSNGATFNFIEKIECMINQYNSYTVEEAGQKVKL